MSRALTILVVALFAACRSGAQATRSPAGTRDTAAITIRAGTLLDGRGNVERDVIVTVRDGRIERVDHTAPNQPEPRVTYDLRSRTVLPGLIDAHVHLGWYINRDGVLTVGHRGGAGGAGDAVADSAMAENLRATLMAGVTTVQSVGGAEDVALRDSVARGALVGPRVLTSIAQITQRDLSPDQLRELVRRLKAQGADLIKLFASAGLGGGGGQTMSDEQLRAICGEAKAQGLRSLVHAISAESVRAATLAGCTQIEHGTFATDAELRLMAEHGTIFDPQVCLVFANYLEHRDVFGRSGFTEQSFAALSNALPTAAAMFAKAIATPKLTIVFGTDAVALAHGQNARELVCRVRDGHQRPMDAIVEATSVAARALGLGDRIGAIAPGLDADIIALDGDPLRDIAAVQRVVFVMRGGKVYK